MKKYKLTNEKIEVVGIKLYRIKALIDFGIVKKGDRGGYIEKESNLSQDGEAWVYGEAQVFGEARVYGNARVYGKARVSGEARVYGEARVSDNAWVYGEAWVSGEARVSGEAKVTRSVISITIPNFYPITIFCEDVKDNYLLIGCKIYRESYWLKNWKEIAKAEGKDIKNGDAKIKEFLNLKKILEEVK